MNYTTSVFLINKNVRAIAVTYEKDTDARKADRTIYKSLDHDIVVGDYVIVETDTRHGMTVCKVAEVDVEPDLDSSHPMRWIIGRVELSSHNLVCRQEQQAIVAIKSAEKNKRREELAKALVLDPERIKALAIANVGNDDTDQSV
jgi:hypothetical protein